MSIGKWFRIESDGFIVEARKGFKKSLSIGTKQENDYTFVRLDRDTVEKLRDWLVRNYPERGNRDGNVRKFRAVDGDAVEESLSIQDDTTGTSRDPDSPRD